MTDSGETRRSNPAGRSDHAEPGAVVPLRDRGERWSGLAPSASGTFDDARESRGPADAAERRLREHVRSVLAAQLPGRVEEQRRRTGVRTTPEAHRALAREIVDGAVNAFAERELTANRPLVSPESERRVVAEVVDELFGMAGLQPLLDDPRIETINANRFDRVFVQYADGLRRRVGPIAGSNNELTELVRLLAARASSQERRFDHGSPSVNLQLPGGERLFAVMAVTVGGVTSLSIRRHRFPRVTLDELRRRGTVDEVLIRFLRACVGARKNLVIVGGTGEGKTTLLRALAAEMDPMERIVTIEDAFELGLDTDPDVHADVTAFQAREANVEGESHPRRGLRRTPHLAVHLLRMARQGSRAPLHQASQR